MNMLQQKILSHIDMRHEELRSLVNELRAELLGTANQLESQQQKRVTPISPDFQASLQYLAESLDTADEPKPQEVRQQQTREAPQHQQNIEVENSMPPAVDGETSEVEQSRPVEPQIDSNASVIELESRISSKHSSCSILSTVHAHDSLWARFTISLLQRDRAENFNRYMGHVKLRQTWIDGAKNMVRKRRKSCPRGSSAFSLDRVLLKHDAGHLAFRKAKCVLHPSATTKLVWDLFGMVLIIYDTFWLPFNLSFEPTSSEVTLFAEYMFWVTLLFWSMDIGLSFSTGYYKEGELIVEHVKIARNYITTWFLPDCVIVGVDWMTVFAGQERGGTSLLRAGKIFRVLRVLRSLRLLRLVKIAELLRAIEDQIASDSLLIVLAVLKLTAVLLLCNHMIACLWWAVGRSHPEGWVEFHGFEDEVLIYKYLSSMHWTLTQFTPAAMEIYPHNTGERAFAVVVLLFALIFFSSYLSSITSAMTQLRKLNEATTTQFALLRRFLKQRRVPEELSIKLKNYLEHRIDSQKAMVQEENVGILALLSEPLFKELKEHLHKPLLCKHPFFQYYCEGDCYAMQSLCQKGLKNVFVSEGDKLFKPGDECEKMVFVVHGTLLYQWQGEDPDDDAFQSQAELAHDWTQRLARIPSPSEMIQFYILRQRSTKPNARLLHEGDWYGEACLWSHWVYAGEVEAVAMSNLLTVDPEIFASVTLKHKRFLRHTSVYGKRFVRDMNASILSQNDLSKSKEEIEEVCKEVFFGVTVSSPSPTDPDSPTSGKCFLNSMRRSTTFYDLDAA